MRARAVRGQGECAPQARVDAEGAGEALEDGSTEVIRRTATRQAIQFQQELVWLEAHSDVIAQTKAVGLTKGWSRVAAGQFRRRS